MATVSTAAMEPRNVLHDIAWQTYLELRENPQNYHPHMTYDEGTLEIISPSPRHEGHARYIDLIIVVWTEELDISVRGLRQMTCKREDLAKGLEPDDCYYVQNEPKVRNKVDIDFAVDPPPDLAIEVEISRSSIPNAPIYAALGVGELWQYDGQILRIFNLVDGRYQSREGSACFPNFPVAKAEELLAQIGQSDDTTFMRQFRCWVRTTFRTGGDAV